VSRAVTESEFKTNNFDLLRILAATQVVLVHSAAHLGLGRPAGLSLVEAFPGVPIFFAISGFLISASFERSRDVRSYTRNRMLRIYPGLWCVVLATVLVATLFGFGFLHLRALFWLACQMGGLIYTPGFLRSFGMGSYNGALWSIPIELQFYFLLPFFYLGVVRTERAPRSCSRSATAPSKRSIPSCSTTRSFRTSICSSRACSCSAGTRSARAGSWAKDCRG
jgi:peptidoglycan/LPS O-acetylase OafA/YrhL